MEILLPLVISGKRINPFQMKHSKYKYHLHRSQVNIIELPFINRGQLSRLKFHGKQQRF